jgi:hypothetical protein
MINLLAPVVSPVGVRRAAERLAVARLNANALAQGA